MDEKTNIEKLREAWDNMPPGAKNRLYSDYGHTHQNVSDILKKGRKDEATILNLLEDIKNASKDVTKEVTMQNQKVQAL